jgi:hypothetical protein
MAAVSATMANPGPAPPIGPSAERIEHMGTQGQRDAAAMIGHLQRGGQGVNRHIDDFTRRAVTQSVVDQIAQGVCLSSEHFGATRGVI